MHIYSEGLYFPENRFNLTLDEFLKSNQYKIMQMVFSSHYMQTRGESFSWVKQIVAQSYSDIILDLYLQNSSVISQLDIDEVHKYGTYKMVKLLVEKYRVKPKPNEIMARIYSDVYDIKKATGSGAQIYYVEQYLSTIRNIEFLHEAWCREYSRRFDGARVMFIRSVINMENLRSIIPDEEWSEYHYYRDSVKFCLLLYLKFNRVTKTSIGVLNDFNQLHRIISGFL